MTWMTLPDTPLSVHKTTALIAMMSPQVCWIYYSSNWRIWLKIESFKHNNNDYYSNLRSLCLLQVKEKWHPASHVDSLNKIQIQFKPYQVIKSWQNCQYFAHICIINHSGTRQIHCIIAFSVSCFQRPAFVLNWILNICCLEE